MTPCVRRAQALQERAVLADSAREGLGERILAWREEPLHRLRELPLVAQEPLEPGDDLSLARVEEPPQDLDDRGLLTLHMGNQLGVDVLLQRLADVAEARLLGLLVRVRERAEADGPGVLHEAAALVVVEGREDGERVDAAVADVGFDGVALDVDENGDGGLRVHTGRYFMFCSIDASCGCRRVSALF